MAAPPKADKNGSMRIDPALVRELAQLLTDNELTEIEVQDGERRIKVARDPAPVIAAAPAAAAYAAAPALSAPPMHAKEDVGAPAEEVAGHMRALMDGDSPEPSAGSLRDRDLYDRVLRGAFKLGHAPAQQEAPASPEEAGVAG